MGLLAPPLFAFEKDQQPPPSHCCWLQHHDCCLLLPAFCPPPWFLLLAPYISGVAVRKDFVLLRVAATGGATRTHGKETCPTPSFTPSLPPSSPRTHDTGHQRTTPRRCACQKGRKKPRITRAGRTQATTTTANIPSSSRRTTRQQQEGGGAAAATSARTGSSSVAHPQVMDAEIVSHSVCPSPHHFCPLPQVHRQQPQRATAADRRSRPLIAFTPSRIHTLIHAYTPTHTPTQARSYASNQPGVPGGLMVRAMWLGREAGGRKGGAYLFIQ